MKALIWITLAFVLIGCKPKEIIIQIPIHDTIRVEKKYIVKDTVIDYKIQYQNVVSVDSSYLSTDLAFSRASIDVNGLLRHSIQNNGLLPSKIVYISKDSVVIRDKPVEVIKTIEVEKKLNAVKKYLINSSIILHILIALILLIYLRKILS